MHTLPTTDSTYIGETRYDRRDLHRELRYSNGSQVWPGYAGTTLRRGYWLGTHASHEYLGRLREARAFLAQSHIEVLTSHPVGR